MNRGRAIARYHVEPQQPPASPAWSPGVRLHPAVDANGGTCSLPGRGSLARGPSDPGQRSQRSVHLRVTTAGRGRDRVQDTPPPAQEAAISAWMASKAPGAGPGGSPMTAAQACWGIQDPPPALGERLHSVPEAITAWVGPRLRWWDSATPPDGPPGGIHRQACACAPWATWAGPGWRGRQGLAQRPQRGDPHVPDRLPPEPVRGGRTRPRPRWHMIMLAQYPRDGVTDPGPTLPALNPRRITWPSRTKLPTRHPWHHQPVRDGRGCGWQTYHVKTVLPAIKQLSSLRPWIGPWVRTTIRRAFDAQACCERRVQRGSRHGPDRFARLIVAAGNRATVLGVLDALVKTAHPALPQPASRALLRSRRCCGCSSFVSRPLCGASTAVQASNPAEA